MFKSLRKAFSAPSEAPSAALPDGERVYAVGDIHGRADLFATLIAGIEDDDAARGAARTTVILLGDLIDRGPDSAEVLRLARRWQNRRKVRILMGNHEEMFLDALDSDEVLRHFLRFGGRETLLSYPIDPDQLRRSELGECRALARAAVPEEDVAFIRTFEDKIEIGDYLFVHAGLRPEVPIAEQSRSDLRWIRGSFLDHDESFGPVVVHGHTIFDEPELRPNRIGVDTGAYASGRLTALGLEGGARWVIETSEAEDRIAISQRSIP